MHDGRTTDGRTPDHGHPISSPCEPSAQVRCILHGYVFVDGFLTLSFLLFRLIEVMARALSVPRCDIGDFTPEISPRMVSQAHFLLYNHGSRPARLVLTECECFEFEEAVQDLLLVLQVHVSRDLRKPVFGVSDQNPIVGLFHLISSDP